MQLRQTVSIFVLASVLVACVLFAVSLLPLNSPARASSIPRVAAEMRPPRPPDGISPSLGGSNASLLRALTLQQTTATPLPTGATTPTALPAAGPSPAATSISDILQTALLKNDSIEKYRGEVTYTEGDAVIVHWVGEGQSEPAAQHYTYSDALVQNVEVIRMADEVYVRAGGEPDAAWSRVPFDQLSHYIAYSPRLAIANVVNNASQFAGNETGTLDGVECEILAQDKAGAAATFYSIVLGAKNPPGDSITDLFKVAEARVWVCEDGYIHQTQLIAELKNSTFGRREITARITDPDADVQITAPTNLVPFPTPTSSPTSTPEPTVAPTLTPSAAEATATAQAAVSLAASSKNWNIFFADSFDVPANDWTTDSYTTDSGKGKVTKKIENSTYIWNLRSARPMVNRESPQFDFYFANAAVSADARWLEGAASCAYGLTLRDDFTNYYYFAIKPDGAWKFARGKEDARIADLLKGSSEAIHKDGVNQLRIINSDGQVQLFVNDSYLGQVELADDTDPTVSGLVMELDKANQSCIVEFDNFQVQIPVGSQHNTVLASGFDNENKANFPTGKYSDGTASGTREIVKDKYVWELTATDSSVDQWAFAESEALTDFTVSVTIDPVEGPERAEAGLVFRASAPNTGYSFSITNFGDYVFRRTENGTSETLIYPTASELIKKGASNRIRVVAIGSHYDFFINDRFVNHLTDDGLARGKTALQARVYDRNGQATFEFSEFELRVAGAETKQATPTPGPMGAQAAATAQAMTQKLQEVETWPVALTGWDEENLAEWRVGETKREGFEYAFSIIDDTYQLKEEMTSSDGFNVYGTAPGNFGDFYLTVDAQRTGGSPEVGYGVVFLGTGESEYTFAINDDFPVGTGSTFNLDRREGNHTDSLASYQDTFAVNKGGVNRLGVLVQDKEISLFINDQLVGSYRDDRVASGRVGVYSLMLEPAQATFEFSNFVLRVPPTSVTPTPSAQEAEKLAQEAQAARETALKWPVIAQDDFSDNANAWPLDDTSPDWGKIQGSVTDGKYRWDTDLKKNIYFYEVAPDMPAVGDFYATVEGELMSGPGQHFYGMVLRVADGKFYKFKIVNERYAALERVDDKVTKLVSETLVPGIKPGAVNKLGVLARGSRFDLFINDEWVAQVQDDALQGGQIGVAFGIQGLEPAIFEFDNFEIRAPQAAPVNQ